MIGDWSDDELVSVPCAYAAAETTLQSAGCVGGDEVLVIGASGGVGSVAQEDFSGIILLAIMS